MLVRSLNRKLSQEVLSDTPVFQPTSLTIAPSWYCDAQCRHCFLPRSVRSKDLYNEQIIDSVLAGLPDSIKYISITGGEPFVFPERLFRICKVATLSGVQTIVVTNGLWASDWSRGNALLVEARKNGLVGLTLSVDRYHAPLAAPRVIARIIETASALGIEIRIMAVGKTAGERWSRICHEYNLAKYVSHFLAHDLDNTGEASRLEVDRVGDLELGECMAATVPLVAPDGTVYACCSGYIFEMCNPVLVRGDVNNESISSIIDRHSRDYLLSALAGFGPSRLLALLGKQVPRSVSSRCKLCVSIFNNTTILEELATRIREDDNLRKEIHGRSMVLERSYLN